MTGKTENRTNEKCRLGIQIFPQTFSLEGAPTISIDLFPSGKTFQLSMLKEFLATFNLGNILFVWEFNI